MSLDNGLANRRNSMRMIMHLRLTLTVMLSHWPTWNPRKTFLPKLGPLAPRLRLMPSLRLITMMLVVVSIVV